MSKDSTTSKTQEGSLRRGLRKIRSKWSHLEESLALHTF